MGCQCQCILHGTYNVYGDFLRWNETNQQNNQHQKCTQSHSEPPNRKSEHHLENSSSW